MKLSDYKGGIVLLNFWSTLCAPCTAEMPSLNRLQAGLKERGFHVLAVAIDASDKSVRDFVTEKRIDLTVLWDREKEVFFDQYAGPSLPATFLIDRNGIIVDMVNGPREWDSPDMKHKILKLFQTP